LPQYGAMNNHVRFGKTAFFPLIVIFSLCFFFLSCAPKVKPFEPRITREATGSVGRPSDGFLVDGKQLRSFPGARVRNPDRCWGTPESVDLLVEAVIETQNQFPGTADLLIGDFSRKNGGYLYPHKSHQSGRDVDLTIYKKSNTAERFFQTATPRNMDVDRVWFLLETLLLTDRVRYVFLDYQLQETLYEYAKWGYSQERLALWFQYPRGKRSRAGIIRHVPGHKDHIHIRFKCPETHRWCVP